MSDLLSVATGDDEVTEHADWVELQCFFKDDASISREDLSRAIQRVGHVGDHRVDDRARNLADLAFDELADRAATLENSSIRSLRYPFELTNKDQVLRYKPRRRDRLSDGLVYLFLLSVTRHSMEAKQRVHSNIDPTHLFERLCAEVLLQFWGGRDGRTEATIIGTSARANGKRSFFDSVNALCGSLREGGGWKTGARSPKAGDGGVDLAICRRFSDGRPGGLVGFAQCKTGVNWRRDISKLRPRAFCQNYMSSPLLLDPQALYMVPCRVNRDRWAQDTNNATAILFDRCRIVEYGDLITSKTLSDSAKWLVKALRDQGVGT